MLYLYLLFFKKPASPPRAAQIWKSRMYFWTKVIKQLAHHCTPRTLTTFHTHEISCFSAFCVYVWCASWTSVHRASIQWYHFHEWSSQFNQVMMDDRSRSAAHENTDKGHGVELACTPWFGTACINCSTCECADIYDDWHIYIYTISSHTCVHTFTFIGLGIITNHNIPSNTGSAVCSLDDWWWAQTCVQLRWTRIKESN